MRIILSLFLSFLMFSGCTVHCTDGGLLGDEGCINATFIHETSCCSGTTLYDLDPAFPIGDTITIDGKYYDNAVQIAGTYEGDIQIMLREFDQDTDVDKKNASCMCFVVEAWDRLPIYVIVQNCNSSVE